MLYCDRGSRRIRGHDAQVRLLAGDLAKAALHPIVEEMPQGRHRERPDIRALGGTGGTDLFDVTICHPLSQARIRDAVQNPLNILKAAWAGKVSRYAAMVHEAGRSVQLLPVPIFTLGGWHPDAHRALCTVATAIAARGMSTFSSTKSILFQRHAALLVTNNALCLMSVSISLRLMLDSGADGIPGWIGTARLPSSGPEEGGSGSQTVSRSRSRSLLKSRDRSRERRFQCSKEVAVKRRLTGCVVLVLLQNGCNNYVAPSWAFSANWTRLIRILLCVFAHIH